MVLKICRIFSYKSFLLQSLYNHQMSRHISECSITNPQESRHRHSHPSMNYFFVTVCIDIWLRLSSYKQLVFHIYLHRFNILKIVTFNKLPCFVQQKSSNASVFFFLFETPVEINTWVMAFVISSNAPYISFIIIATNITIIRKKIPRICYELCHHYQSSYRLSVMSQRGIAPHCVLQLTPSVHFIEV